MSGWIGVDLDGTLAHYGGWVGPDHIGEPIMPMVERVKRWLAEGKEVKIELWDDRAVRVKINTGCPCCGEYR